MKSTIENLIMLQEVDTQILEMERLLGDLPRRVERLRAEFDEKGSDLRAREEQLEAHEKQRRELEAKVEDSREHERKFQEQLYQVTNNREYDAVTHELETIAEQVEEAEQQILEHMEEEDKLNAELEEGRPELERLKEELDAANLELNEKTESNRAVADKLQDDRKELASHIRRPILSSYDRVRGAREGVGLVPVKDGFCSGCKTSVPPQRMLEIRLMKQLYTCEVCGRVLIWPPGNNAPASTAEEVGQ